MLIFISLGRPGGSWQYPIQIHLMLIFIGVTPEEYLAGVRDSNTSHVNLYLALEINGEMYFIIQIHLMLIFIL